jgi:DNA polymerase III delta subunit
MAGSPVAYFWGEDAWSVDDAARRLALAVAEESGAPLESWRVSGDEGDTSENATPNAGRRRERVLDQIEERLSTATLFGGGTFVIVRQPGSLVRESGARDRLMRFVANVAPGNALCFVDLLAQGSKGLPAHQAALRDTVAAAGGVTGEYPALTRERMEAWIANRAKELDVSLGPGAARLLAERVGAYVREGDVDRRRMTELANAELEKLALYRPGGTASRDDIEALVSEAVPGSTWAFLDSIGYRRAGEAATLAGRLLKDATPMPVLITQVHRRLRELITVRDHVAAGTKPADLVRELKVQPYRAQKLTEQARTWDQAELDSALNDLFELDLLSKGIASDGSPRSLSEDRSQLAFVAWIGNHASRRGQTPAGVRVRDGAGGGRRREAFG